MKGQCYIFLGAPGSGKGTQADKLAQKSSLKKITTGDLIREELSKDTSLAKEIQQIVNKGQLVGDEIILELVKKNVTDSMKKDGFITDGFPRTYKQAKDMDEIVKDMNVVVVYLKIELEKLVERILQRKTCEKCKKVYHDVFNPPQEEGICDVCAGKLILRKDDTREVLEERFKCFEQNNNSLLEYYGDSVIEIDGTLDVDQVFTQIERKLLKYLTIEVK